MKVIVVTGASRGIGYATVEECLSLDPESVVYGVARSQEPLAQLEERYPGRFFGVCRDVCDEKLPSELFERVQRDHGRLDAVVANAGVLEPVHQLSDTAAYSVAQWKAHFDVNFFSVVTLVTTLLPLLQQSRGSVVLVSSGASVKSYNGWACYCAAKAALNSFARSLATDIPECRAIAVAPGVVDTQMQVEIRDVAGPRGMAPQALQRFTDLQRNHELLDPRVPGRVYASLATRGVPATLNGQYLRYSDPQLHDLHD